MAILYISAILVLTITILYLFVQKQVYNNKFRRFLFAGMIVIDILYFLSVLVYNYNDLEGRFHTAIISFLSLAGLFLITAPIFFAQEDIVLKSGKLEGVVLTILSLGYFVIVTFIFYYLADI